MDKATALKVLRGMLNLSQFDLTENQLRSQFLEYEGFEIPYKTFGFNTFLDFLRESNEFVLTTKSGFVYVRAKESKNSSHLVKYVAGQNKPKKKKNDKVMPFIPPLRKTLTNNNWSQKVRLNDMSQRNVSTTNKINGNNSRYFAKNLNRNNIGHSNDNWNPKILTPHKTSNVPKVEENWDDYCLQQQQSIVKSKPVNLQNVHQIENVLPKPNIQNNLIVSDRSNKCITSQTTDEARDIDQNDWKKIDDDLYYQWHPANPLYPSINTNNRMLVELSPRIEYQQSSKINNIRIKSGIDGNWEHDLYDALQQPRQQFKPKFSTNQHSSQATNGAFIKSNRLNRFNDSSQPTQVNKKEHTSISRERKQSVNQRMQIHRKVQDMKTNEIASTAVADQNSPKEPIEHEDKLNVENAAAARASNTFPFSHNSYEQIAHKYYGFDVNEAISQQIRDQTKTPQLKSTERNVVLVTHVNHTGVVYCHFYGCQNMHLIQQIINRLMVSLDDTHRVDPTDSKHANSNELYLVYDKATGRYYRAMILQHNTLILHPTNTVTCQFVDYGEIKNVEYKDIYSLDRLSCILSKYPKQAIALRLNGIEPHEYSPTIISQLQDILCCGKMIYLDVIDTLEIPHVNAWKVNNGNLFNINDMIRKEIEMEITPDMVSLPESHDTFDSDEEVKDIAIPIHPIPELHRLQNATVITAFNPKCFYVRLNCKKSHFSNMHNSLWIECENSKETLSKNDIKLEHFYAGRSSDGFWYRVKAQGFLSNDMVAVEKWDIGDVDHLPVNALRPLGPSYRKTPRAVFCAQLHGMKSSHVWDKGHCERFQYLTVGKSLKINVKRIRIENNSNKYIAELELITEENVNIGEQFNREFLAKHE